MYNKIIKCGDYIEYHQYQLPPAPGLFKGKGWSDNPVRTQLNANTMRKVFMRYMRCGLARSRGTPVLVTLTFATYDGIWDRQKFDFITSPVDIDNARSVKFAYRELRLFNQRLAYEYPGMSYIAVPEFQDKNGRGAVHFHMLVWGIPFDDVFSEEETRKIARIWTHGFVDVKLTNGSPKLAGYLGKYLRKNMWDKRLFGKKCFTRSRNFPVPEEIITSSMPELALKLVLCDDVSIIYKRDYFNEYLGYCNYTLYYNNTDYVQSQCDYTESNYW